MNFKNSNTIGLTKKAVFLNDMSNMKTDLELYFTEKFIENNGEYESEKLFSDATKVTYNEKVVEGNISTIIPTISKKKEYTNNFLIEHGKLVYIGSDDIKKEWFNEFIKND